MTKQQITENYFRRLGWGWKTITIKREADEQFFNERTRYIEYEESFWEAPETLQGTQTLKDLPDITESFSAFKKWVIEEMERRGQKPNIMEVNQASRCSFTAFCWGPWATSPVEIIDNEILSAAVIAATRYLENEDAKG